MVDVPILSNEMRWNPAENPSISFSKTARNASGVTSRPVRPVPPPGIDVPEQDAKQLAEGIRQLGGQIEILRKTRDYAPTIAIVAPRPGFVVSRFTSPGARVAAAEPLFLIAAERP